MNKITQIMLGCVLIGLLCGGVNSGTQNSHWLTDEPKQEDVRLNRLAQRLNALEMKWDDANLRFEESTEGAQLELTPDLTQAKQIGSYPGSTAPNIIEFRNSLGSEVGAISEYGRLRARSVQIDGATIYDENNRLMVRFSNGDVFHIAGY